MHCSFHADTWTWLAWRMLLPCRHRFWVIEAGRSRKLTILPISFWHDLIMLYAVLSLKKEKSASFNEGLLHVCVPFFFKKQNLKIPHISCCQNTICQSLCIFVFFFFHFSPHFLFLNPNLGDRS
jgi:hypothetical protein